MSIGSIGSTLHCVYIQYNVGRFSYFADCYFVVINGYC